MIRSLAASLALGALLSTTLAAQAPPAYGPPVSIDSAKKAAAAAVAEAKKNNLLMAIAIVDPAGMLVYFEKMDGTQNGSVEVAVEKARSAALYKRPSKAFQDTVAGGGAGVRILGLTGAVPVEGGIPLVEGGRIVGAVGASGGTSDQDGVVAQAGVNAVK